MEFRRVLFRSSDWAGDDAVITHVHDEIRKFHYMGDVQRVSGEVLAKRQDGGQSLVDVAVQFTNQSEEETVRAAGTIALPHKVRPLQLDPSVTEELAGKEVGWGERSVGKEGGST